ncbi:MAG TPA: DUF2007 domain-containing protein, partial [Vicinamibacterales bacterium]|nr:DUF2007 domain-containing protein [Vicinamibacterales bacterium]
MAQVRVHSAPTAAIAEMVKDILVQRDIEATTRRSPSLLGTLSGLTEVWIEDEADLPRAREIVEEFLK